MLILGASRLGSVRTNKVVVVTVANLLPTCLAISTAASPVTQYSAFTYPVTFPEVIWYQPFSSDRKVPTESL